MKTLNSKMRSICLGLAGAVSLLGSVESNAVPTLRLTSGATSFFVEDEVTTGLAPGQVADNYDGEVGVVQFSGTIGDWKVNTSTGISESQPMIDLASYNKSTKASTLKLEFSDVFLSSGAGDWAASIGGTLAGSVLAPGGASSVTFNAYMGAGLFSHDILLGTYTFTNPLDYDQPFSSPDLLNNAIMPNGGSLTIEVILVHGKKGATSFDGVSQKVPDGGVTATLLGLGLLALASYPRRNG